MVAETTVLSRHPSPEDRLDASAINQLKWRCRRGLLENDLFIERFFSRHEQHLTQGQAAGLMTLMDLPDNDLLDLLLRRRDPEGELASEDVLQVLALMRTPA
ncbi:MAG: succinate dehydrogenase assembly factor 2 [Betaproteobacteria bacterium]